MTIPNVLGAVGAGFLGYGKDQERRKTEAAQKLEQERADRTTRIQELLANRTLKTPITISAGQGIVGDDGGVTVPLPKTETVFTDKGLMRIPEGGAPGPVTVPGVDGALERPKTEPSARFTFPTVTGPDGNNVVARGNTLTGELEPTGVVGKTTESKPTEAQEKSFMFYRIMKEAQPQMDTLLQKGNIRPDMLTLHLRSGPLDFMTNRALNPDEQVFLRALRDFTAAVNRKETGATITNDEMRETMNRYVPLSGDSEELMAAKNKARADYLGILEQSAGPALQFYQRMDATQQRTQGQPHPGAEAKGGKTLSPQDAEMARTDPGFAAWLKSQGYEVP